MTPSSPAAPLYPREERARVRAAVKEIVRLEEEARKQNERGVLMVPKDQETIKKLTRTEDALRWVDSLSAMGDTLQTRHLERLYPLAANEFNAFCEVMIPEEPPESPWHTFLTDKLEEIERNPDMGRFILNCPPGHAKPLREDTPVLMGDGSWKALGEIRVGDTVVTDQGRPRKVTAVHEQGTLPILRIETRQGRVIHSAYDHSFRVGLSWKQAEDLRPGDPLEVVRLDDHVYPVADAALVELAAWWTAYGTVGLMRRKGVAKAILNPQFWVPEARLEGLRAALAAAGRECSIHPVRGSGGYAARLAPTKNPDLVASFGLARPATERRVPEFVMVADDDAARAFLGRFLSERAECPKRYKLPRLVCYMRSAALARDLQRLLARFEVPASVDEPRAGIGGRTMLEIDEDGIAALKAAGIVYEGVYADRVAGIEPARASLADTVHRVSLADPARCLCLTVAEDHTFLADGVVVHNSTYASRLFVVWRMGRNPNLQVIGGGHSQTFVENEFSTKNRNLVGMPAYQRVFPGVLVDPLKRAKGQWGLAGYKGQYVAKGVGQGVHGFRAHFIVVDDPYAMVEDAESPRYRERVRTWFLTDLATRLLPGGKLFVIMTRFHEEDLTGSLLELNKKLPPEKRYAHVEAPAICYDPENDVLGRRLGEVLWDVYSLDEFEDKRIGQKYQQFALIYQQIAAAAEEGNIASQFRDYDVRPDQTPEVLKAALDAGDVDRETGKPNPQTRNVFRRIVVSVDTATKDNERADWTVVQVWGETHDRKHYLLDQKREKVEFNDLIVLIERTARLHGADYILVEDKGNGTAYIQARGSTEHQRRLAPCPVVGIKTPSNQGKAFRFDEICPMIEQGEVYLPKMSDWRDLFVQEVGQFPEGNHDDQVDALTQYLRWAKTKRARFGAKKVGSMG